MWRLGRGAKGLATLASALGVAAVCAGPALAAFPLAQNGEIAYHRYDTQFDVFKMSATGAGQANLTNDPGYDVAPSYSPDGRRIVFIRQVGGHNDVFLMGADGSAPVDLTNTPGLDETSPVFSPDGRSIAYTSDDEVPGPVDLHLMKADGSGQHVLISTSGIEKAPDFSPDGTKIAFESCEASCDIYTIAPDGSNLTNVSNTPAPTSEGDPAFSPDGRRIVMTRSLGIGMGGIGVMNADGTGASNITLSTGPEGAPSFSPDGRLILYAAKPPSDGTTDLFTRNADGTNPVDLTNTLGPLREESPAWQWVFTCGGRQATIIGTDSGEKLKGTKRADVIVGNGGNDRIKGLGGRDRICGGTGRDRLAGGKGRPDICRGQQGKDYGGKGCERGKL